VINHIIYIYMSVAHDIHKYTYDYMHINIYAAYIYILSYIE